MALVSIRPLYRNVQPIVDCVATYVRPHRHLKSYYPDGFHVDHIDIKRQTQLRKHEALAGKLESCQE